MSGGWAPALAMLAAGLLAWGGVRTLRRDRLKGVLMVVAAAVLVGNVLVLTM